MASLAEVDLGQLKPEVREAVAHIVADKLGRPLTEEEEKPETTFDQLGLDSLDRMELNLRVEQQYGFTSDQVPATLGQLWALAAGTGQERATETAAARLVRAGVRAMARWKSSATPSPKPSSPAPSAIRATWWPPTTWPASSPTNAC